jgi:hypothetical protein
MSGTLNIKEVDCLSVDSYGSTVFKCTFEGYPVPRCVKVVFTSEKPQETVCNRKQKEVTSLPQVVKEAESQRLMYQKIYERLGDSVKIVPDVISTHHLTPDEFNELFEDSIRIDDAGVWIESIYTTSLHNNFGLTILVMEYLNDFVAFDPALHEMVLPCVHANILALFIITSGMSLDMHPLNILINTIYHAIYVRIIDFGKVVFFNNPDDKKDVKSRFLELVNFYKKDKVKLIQLYCCFCTEPPQGKDIETLASDLITNFGLYCDSVSNLYVSWMSTPQKNKLVKIYDLLTFIGFVDNIYKYKASATMQFGELIKLLFEREGSDDDDDLTYIIKLRSKLYNNKTLNRLLMSNQKLSKIVDILDSILSSKKAEVVEVEEVDGGKKRYSMNKRRKHPRKKRTKQTYKKRKLKTSRRKH